MLSIFKREMHSYFTTSTGYIFLAISIALSAVVFGITTLMIQTSYTRYYFTVIIFMFLIFLPILTMKTFSDEKKTKTEQLLYTSPVSMTGIVMGKFLACSAMFTIYALLSSINFFVLSKYAVTDFYTQNPPNVPMIVGGMIAVLLVGMAFIAIGVFVSSLTENQFAAVIITIVVLLFFLVINLFNGMIGWYPIRIILSWLSIFNRYQNFTYGIFDFGALVYYLSVMGVFLFLTVRVLDSRRYR
ncbi:MAG: ABC transporter permease subunit [Clostridia bacterium]|nr:ABC transporter permease subunit [Clostridia bacterium]